MKTPTPHPHAAMIAEWIKDISRVVQYQNKDGVWHTQGQNVPRWRPAVNYRFADTAKPVIVSSFTDEELIYIQGRYPATSCHINNIRNLANTVAARAIEDLPVLNCSLDGDTLYGIYSKFYRDNDMCHSLEHVAVSVIDDYIKQVKGGGK